MAEEAHTENLETPEEERATEEVSAPAESQSAPDQVDYQAQWQRALADLENAKRRFETDRLAALKFGQKSLLEALLPVVDNFYRATEHVPDEQKDSSWVMGIQYIQKNLLDVLEGEGVSEISAKPGDAFNAHKHEAVSTEASETAEDHIIRVANRGYMLHDRVLRPVQVVVSSGSETK